MPIGHLSDDAFILILLTCPIAPRMGYTILEDAQVVAASFASTST